MKSHCAPPKAIPLSTNSARNFKSASPRWRIANRRCARVLKCSLREAQPYSIGWTTSQAGRCGSYARERTGRARGAAASAGANGCGDPSGRQAHESTQELTSGEAAKGVIAMAKATKRVSPTSSHGRIKPGVKEDAPAVAGPAGVGVSGTASRTDGVDDVAGVSGFESGN